MRQQLLVQQQLAQAQRTLSRASLVLPITVGVRFTVYTTVASPKQNTSNVPDAIIKKQMEVLNTHYASSVCPRHVLQCLQCIGTLFVYSCSSAHWLKDEP